MEAVIVYRLLEFAIRFFLYLVQGSRKPFGHKRVNTNHDHSKSAFPVINSHIKERELRGCVYLFGATFPKLI